MTEVPGFLQDLLEIVVGMRWPDGDEDQLRQLGSAWRQVGSDLRGVRQDAAQGIATLEGAVKGPAHDAFTAYWSKTFDNGAAGGGSGSGSGAPAIPVLPWSVEFCDMMANACDNMALEIETTKDMIIGQLMILFGEIAATTVSAFFDFGASEAAVPEEIAVTRSICSQLLDSAVGRILKHMLTSALEQALMQGGLDLAIQLKEIAEGHRSGIAWQETGQAAGSGAIYGAVGGALSGGLSLAGGRAAKFAASGIGRLTVGGAGGGLGAAAIDLATTGHVSFADVTKGVLGGAAGAGLHLGGEHLTGGLTSSGDHLQAQIPEAAAHLGTQDWHNLTTLPDTVDTHGSSDILPGSGGGAAGADLAPTSLASAAGMTGGQASETAGGISGNAALSTSMPGGAVHPDAVAGPMSQDGHLVSPDMSMFGGSLGSGADGGRFTTPTGDGALAAGGEPGSTRADPAAAVPSGQMDTRRVAYEPDAGIRAKPDGVPVAGAQSPEAGVADPVRGQGAEAGHSALAGYELSPGGTPATRSGPPTGPGSGPDPAGRTPGPADAASSRDGGMLPITGGEHVIQISGQLSAAHVELAVAHEIGEIAEDRNRYFAGDVRYFAGDVLRPGGIAADAKLTPHDAGRVQELRVLGEQLDRLPSAGGRTPEQQRRYDEIHRESMALVEHLGLRDGTPGAQQRRALVFERLTPEGQDHVRGLFGDAGRAADTLSPHDQELLRSIQHHADGVSPVGAGADHGGPAHLHDPGATAGTRTEHVLTTEHAPAPELHKAQADARDTNQATETFLLLCTEYSARKGGVVVFNRALAEGLADAGHDVVVRIGEDASPYAGEQRPNLRIIGPRDLPENPDSRKLLAAQYDPKDMPEHVDYVIGHTRFSGTDARATRDAKYPDARLIHFVHMVPEALGRVKGEPAEGIKNHAIERDLVAHADLAVGVGPAITENVREMVRQAQENAAQTGEHGATQVVHELIPGMEFRDRGTRSTDGRPLNVFIFGRTDVGQKGAVEAAEVVGRLREAGSPVRLIVRGVPADLVEEQRLSLSEIVGDSVEVRPFTVERSDLYADLNDADVMVMTSRAEGFGLTAQEASAAGVPVVVPSSSGFGRWLGESGQFSPDLTGPSIVKQGFEDQVPKDLWFDALKTVAEDYPAAQRRALDFSTFALLGR